MSIIKKIAVFTVSGVVLSGAAQAEMALTSSDIAEGQALDNDQVLNGFGCEGGNLSPSLSWTGAPEGTQSYVVTAYDPDAPTGSGLWHWSVVNVPASVTSLPEGAGTENTPLPDGAIVVRNDLSQNGFAGACPPEGQSHRYIFQVFAMPQAALPVDETASSALVGFFANTSALDRAAITATYER